MHQILVQALLSAAALGMAVGTRHDNSVSGQPKDDKKPGVLRFYLSGFDAVRLKAIIDSDYPLGNETQRRKTYGSQVKGRDARFLSILEPFEEKNMIVRTEASEANTLRDELKDGRTQTLHLSGLDSVTGETAIAIEKTDASGKPLRSEKSEQPLSTP